MTQVNDVGSMELLVLDRGDRRQLCRAAGDRRAAVSVAGFTDDGDGDRPEPETGAAELLALREGDVVREDDVSVLWERIALVEREDLPAEKLTVRDIPIGKEKYLPAENWDRLIG